MSERYVKLYSTDNNLYVDDSPIVIRAGALQKDNTSGKVFAQLKLQNVSEKTISYVKVILTSIDAAGNGLGDPISYEYLDLNISDTTPFGTKQPLRFPNHSTRSFKVGVSTVVFSDGTVWSCDNTDWASVSADSVMSVQLSTKDAYQQALALINNKKHKDALPILENIKDNVDVTNDITNCETAIANARKKRRKSILFLTIGILLLGALGYFVIYPWISVANGDYSVYINMYNIEHFTIPDNVDTIEDCAFYGCNSLETITIPNSVTHIGREAFRDCTSLTSVDIPNNVTYIGYGAFTNCSSLTSIKFPDHLDALGHGELMGDSTGVIAGCTSLTSVTIPDTVQRIAPYSFSGCENLTTITIPKGVNEIPEGTFYGCQNLTSVSLPDAYIFNPVWSGVFEGCEQLTTINFDGTIKRWESFDISFSHKVTVFCSDGTYTYE